MKMLKPSVILILPFFIALSFKGNAQIEANSKYKIQHEYSGKYIYCNESENGKNFISWSILSPTDDAKFQFTAIEAEKKGYYYLLHDYSGKYLCTGGLENGSNFHTWGPIPIGHESRYLFKVVESTKNGYYYLLHEFSGKYLCTGGLENGSNFHTWGPIPVGHESRYRFQFSKQQQQPQKNLSYYQYIRQKIEMLPNITDIERDPIRPPSLLPEQVIIQNGRGLKKSGELRAIEQKFDNFVLFQPSIGSIFPGALISSSSTKTGNPALITIPRKSIDIFIPISHSTNIVERNVEPTAAGVAVGLNKILTQNSTGYRVSRSKKIVQVTTTEQTLLELEISTKFAGALIKGSYFSKRNTTNTMFVSEASEQYYTLAYSLKNEGIENIFQEGIEKSRLDEVLNSSNPPMYISQVVYGRRRLYIFESSSDSAEVRANLLIANEVDASKLKFDFAYSKLLTLQDLSIKYIDIGAGKGAGAPVSMDIVSFLESIKTNSYPSADSPGDIISFSVNYLKDNQVFAKIDATNFETYRQSAINLDASFGLGCIDFRKTGESGNGEFRWRLKYDIEDNGKLTPLEKTDILKMIGTDNSSDEQVGGYCKTYWWPNNYFETKRKNYDPPPGGTCMKNITVPYVSGVQIILKVDIVEIDDFDSNDRQLDMELFRISLDEIAGLSSRSEKYIWGQTLVEHGDGEFIVNFCWGINYLKGMEVRK